MKTILLVDDSPTILMSMEVALQEAGYEVIKALSGEQALAQLKAAAPVHLMITDLNMPVMDGITLIREARKVSARRFMPVLVLTTESMQAKRDEARAAGASGWLVKPVAAQELLIVLKQILPP